MAALSVQRDICDAIIKKSQPAAVDAPLVWTHLVSSPPQTGSPPALHSAAARVPPALCKQTQTKSQRQEARLQARARARLSVCTSERVCAAARVVDSERGRIYAVQEFWETLLIRPEW